MPLAFSQERCDKYDMLGKTWAEELFLSLGAKLVRHNESESTGEEGYWDSLFSIRELEFRIGVEIKAIKYFLGGRLKYARLDIPWRKKKDMVHFFVVISSDGKSAYMVRKDLADEFMGNKPHKKDTYLLEADEFYSLPLEMCNFYYRGSVTEKWKEQ